MRRIVMTGAFTLALTLEACAAKQPPTQPPLNLVTEAEPKAEAQKRRLGDLQNTGVHALSL
jgi:hypothetical protein